MDLSILIPTHARPEKAAKLAQALGRQSCRGFEVLIGIDGPDDRTEPAVRAAWETTGRPAADLTVMPLEKMGQAAVRNRLLEVARGEFLVFFNDDVLPEPQTVAAHLEGQRNGMAQSGNGALILGDCPWVVHEPDRLFDRLVRETSMVFFYHRMNEPEARGDRSRDWGFRHAWSLNLSAPAAAVREAGGFTVFPCTYGFEDDELAYRLTTKFEMPVLYRPEATALHDHRMEPRDYLMREFKLGYAALRFAQTTPQCAQAMYRRDITADDELSYSRAYVERERTAAAAALGPFEELTEMPAEQVGGPNARELLHLIYQQHLLLKRWMWRAGLVAAAEGGVLEEVQWPE